MAISFIDKAFAVIDSNVTSVDVTVPSHNTDDLIFVWMSTDGASPENLAFSGGGLSWTHLTELEDGSMTGRGAWAIGDATSASGFTGTQTSDTVEQHVCIVAIFRGVDTTTPIGVSATVLDNTISPTVTQTTGTTSNSWAIACATNDRDRLIPDAGWPTNTTGVYAKKSDTGSAACGGSVGYDTTGDVDSEVYTWSDLSAADGTATAVYELLEAVASSIPKSDSTAAAASASGAVDDLFSQSTKAGTAAASSVGSINAMFGDTNDTGTAAVAAIGSLDGLLVSVSPLGTADVSAIGTLDSLSAVLLTTGTAAVASVGAIQSLDSFSTLAGGANVAAVGSINDLYGELTAASAANVEVIGTVDSVAVLLSGAGTVNAAVVGSLDAIDAVLLTTSTVNVSSIGSIQLLESFTTLASGVGVSALGTLNDLHVQVLDSAGASIAVVGSVASVATLLYTTGTVDASALGSVVGILNELATVNGTVAVTINGGGESVVPGGPPAAGPPTYKGFYGFGFGRGF